MTPKRPFPFLKAVDSFSLLSAYPLISLSVSCQTTFMLFSLVKTINRNTCGMSMRCYRTEPWSENCLAQVYCFILDGNLNCGSH